MKKPERGRAKADSRAEIIRKKGNVRPQLEELSEKKGSGLMG